MQGPIIQSISLVLAGKAVAQGLPIKAYWPEASVFRFCRSVQFFDGVPDNPSTPLIEYAADPTYWLARCSSMPSITYRLIYLPSRQASISDRLSVGFAGGGGSWLVEVGHDNDVDWWEPHWRIGNRRDPERRIWEVDYFRIPVQPAYARAVAADPDPLVQRLKTSLKAIATFARRQNLDHFADVFDAARNRLQAAVPFDNLIHADIDPGNLLTLKGRQILAAAQIGWVFGGMGSWNDVTFPGVIGAEYERLSEELFTVMTDAAIVAVNQGVRSVGSP